MKHNPAQFSDQQALAQFLGVQLEAIRESISMLEQGSSCIEIVQHLQRIEAALTAANMELSNIHLTKYLSDLAHSEHTEEALREISMLFCCLNKLAAQEY
ncbi:MAG: metal-sensing transcriptional repressor [Anaerolineae bacterium]|nr:metal-sensing transcriptional repressor [Anaerolineae bacterium]